MSRFHITKIAASGPDVKYSSVPFEDGVNFIVGPSNTGKSYVIGCIDFMFGGKEVPFSKDDTGYDTVMMDMESDDGYYFSAERKIEEGSSGDKGSNVVHVSTNLPGVHGDEFKINTKEYSDLLMRIIGIEERTKIIATQAPKDEDLTFRTIFHLFFINEENIFKKQTAFDDPSYSKITASLTSLLYLINGDNLERFLPEVSVEELENRATRKAGVISYLNQKIAALSEQKKQLEESMAADEGVDIDARIDEFVSEIEKVEKQIVDALEESRRILAQIYEQSAKLQEARFLGNRYRTLHSQYMSDIKRLNFIVEGDAKGKQIRHKDNCPFCGHEMDDEEEDRTTYVESAKAELARIRLQLGDLEATEIETKQEIKEIEESLKGLNAQNTNITKLLNQELRPHAAELRSAVAEYRRIQQVRQQLQSIAYMSTELGTDVFEKENEEDEKATKFDAKQKFDKNIWRELSDSVNEMIKDCAYTGKPESYLSINTADVVVGGRHKKNQGKGYRAFLNTIMLFNLMKYLENSGKYPSHILILDSPILSLKEKKHKLTAKDITTVGMRESLIQYIMDNCGNNQVIIAENELPDTLNYQHANQIIFTMDEEGDNRYGFLHSVRNPEEE